MSLYYDLDEDGVHKSPGLEPIVFKAKPSPSPPPYIPPQALPTPSCESDLSSKRNRTHRRAQPSQADQVLLNFMSPNTPDIARKAATEALNSASQSEDDSSSEDRSTRPKRKPRQRVDTAQRIDGTPLDLTKVAQSAMAVTRLPGDPPGMDNNALERQKSESRSPTSPELSNRVRKNSEITALFHGVTLTNTSDDSIKAWDEGLKKSTSAGTKSSTDGHRNAIKSAMSPRLRSLSIPQAIGDPNTLPTFRAPQSPAIGTKGLSGRTPSLPGFQHLDDIVAKAEADRNKDSELSPQSYHARSSVSSTPGGPGHSPVMVTRHDSVARHYSVGSQAQALSPSSYLPPLTHASPVSVQNDPSPRDLFRQPMVFANGARRPSQASDGAQNFGPPLSSSSESFSPTSQASPRDTSHRMSIDGMARPFLPPPQPTVIPGLGIAGSLPLVGIGGFKCDFSGCTAPPFQTQYLLNSHANVHSSNRPHYCPVPGCSRAEGGKGFKRKNEMIRHGLVHDSPGYVCPFCPDREHKYPRPDNLQRHVRVHHVDKDKDDPQLREVLAQRPEGGTRGRRRRIGERLEFR